MVTENDLTLYGFYRFEEWDWTFGDMIIQHYRFEKSGKVFRARIEKNNGPHYVRFGLVSDVKRGITNWIEAHTVKKFHEKISKIINLDY